jgi:hypothetical protein
VESRANIPWWYKGTMNSAKQLRDLLRRDALTIAPGAYDGITARLIERAGFPSVPPDKSAGGQTMEDRKDLSAVRITGKDQNAG